MHSSLIWSRIPTTLSNDRDVVLIDLPGFGGETLRRTKKSLVDVGTDLLSVLSQLDEEMHIETIVADSLGGILLLEGVEMTNFVRGRNVLLSGLPLEGLPVALKYIPMRIVLPVSIFLVRNVPMWLGKALVSSTLWFSVQLQRAIGDEIYQSVKQADAYAAAYYFEQMGKRFEHTDFVGALSKARAAIVARGQFDHIARYQHTKDWAAVLGAEFIEFPGAGHTPMMEAASLYFNLITNMSCRTASDK